MSTTPVHTCARTGAVVSARHHVPAPTHEWWWGGGGTVGCNQLRCRDCGAKIRQQPGIRLGRPRDLPAPEVVYAAEDWTALAGLVADGGRSRLYACRCRLHAETAIHLLDVVPREITDLDLPWACDGHPAATLPFELDGVALHDGLDVHALAIDVLRGRHPVPPYADVASNRGFWLERLAGLVPSFEAQIARAVVEVLGDEDPLVVQRALHWLRARPQWLPTITLAVASAWEATPVPPAGALTLGTIAGQVLVQRIRWEGERDQRGALDTALAWLEHGVGASSLAWPVAEADLAGFLRVFAAAASVSPAALPDLLRPVVKLQPEAAALALRRLAGVDGLSDAPVDDVLASMTTGREDAQRAWREVQESGG